MPTSFPAIAEVVRALRAEGVKIGSSTGYTREIMGKITPRAAELGFTPDSLVCTGDTAEGRPSPLMFYKGLIDLNVWPAWSAIKVDDTTVGVAEGLNAGAWAVGIAVSGNCFGLSLADAKALAPEDFARRRARAHNALYGARPLRGQFRCRPHASRRSDRRTPRPRRAALNRRC